MFLVNVSFFLAMLVSKVTAALWQRRLWYADHLMETTLAPLNALPMRFLILILKTFVFIRQ